MNEGIRAVLGPIREALSRRLRGPRVSRLLERFGIDPKRYWLLVDLFRDLADRGEMLDQLGTNGVALDFVAWMYFGLSALLSILFVIAQPAPASYFLTFQALSAFLLLTILLSETGNSLVNPVEALVLAHQPIDGATYTAAKLSHLLRIVLFLAPALNAVPALAGLELQGAGWAYPFLHLGAAFAIGLVTSLVCCALFGWLIRFVPAKRLKAAGQLAGTMPFLGMMWFGQISRFVSHLHVGRWLPPQAAVRWGLAAVCTVAAVAAVALGIRSLSVDYLIRVSSIVRGGASAGSKVSRSRLGEIVCRFFGGQPARGGFAFVSRMMLRDWQFRRQLVPMAVMLGVGLSGVLVEGMRIDPFSGKFTPMHLLPHFLGMLLFFVCNILVYSSEYKGAWIFQLAPSRAFDGFAGGVFAMLWIEVIVIPLLILTVLLAGPWGLWHAWLFGAYSVAAASVYLALELRLIDGAPFSKPMDPSRGMSSLAIVMAGGLGMALAVGVQYFLVFRSPALVAAATVALGAVAYLAARSAIRAFAVSIRHNLGLISGESGGLYKEVGV